AVLTAMPTRSYRLATIVAALLAAILLTSLVLRGVHLCNREVSLDEFEHAHGAYLVARGQRPYVHFFEHHPPLFPLLAAPLSGAGADLGTILALRGFGLGASLLAAVLTVLLVARTRGKPDAFATGALLLASALLFEYGFLVYLDTFAAPLVVLSAYALCGR